MTLSELAREEVDRVVVVDNGSSDDTAEIARSLGVLTVSESHVGYGSACQRGIVALADEVTAPDVLVFVDADDAAAPAQLERLVEPIRCGDADLVLGRRLDGDSGSLPRHARLGNRFVSAVLRRLYGSQTRDMGPFRAVRFEVLRDLALDDPDFGWNVQMQVRALRNGYRVAEVPVTWERRALGASKISGSFRGSMSAGWRMVATLVRETVRGPREGSAISREEM